MSLEITVTGATGFVGNNLIRQLIGGGNTVNVIVRPESSQRPFEGLDLNIIEGNLDDPDLINSVFSKCDVVVHAAAHIWFGRTQLEKSRQVNVELTRLIAQQARKNKVRMVYVSTVDTLAASRSSQDIFDEAATHQPKSKTVYTITKREAESVMLDEVKKGLDGVIINPSFMVGPWDWKPSSGQVMIGIANSWVPMAPGGGLSVADVRDVCRGIVAAINDGRSGERYILAGHNLPYLQLWKMYASKVGKSWPRWPLPGLFARAVGRYSDIRRLFNKDESVANFAAMMVAQKYSYYSSEKAMTEFGYEISPLEPAIDDAFDWLTEFGYF